MANEGAVIELSKNLNAPLVMLFGWAGCRDRYLSKYSAMYQNAGYSVLRYTVEFDKIVAKPFQAYEKYAYLIYEKALRNNTFPSIVMHAFSMNGGSLVAALWQVLGRVEDGSMIKQKISGIIFDSAPAYTDFYRLASASSLVLWPRKKHGIVAFWMYRILAVFLSLLYSASIWLESFWVKNVWAKYFGYFYMCEIRDLPKKQLVIYSYSDTICLPKSIEYYIAKQKLQNVNFTCVVFTDSPHCEHLRIHEKEYVKACMDFTHSCFAMSN